MEEYDVIICGAGPAGLSTGIATLFFNKNARVLILESREEVGEEKCAEGLSEDWFKHMKRFGRFLRMKLKRKCFENKMFGVLLVLPSGKKIVARKKKQQGWVLNKDYFLKNLASVFQRMGGELKTGTSVVNPVIKNGIVYGVETNDNQFIRGKCVVDATGLNQIVWRKALNITEPIDKKDVEVCCQYKVEGCKIEDPGIVEIYFGSSIAPGGYGWVFPKGKERANVGVGCQASRVMSAVPFQKNFWKMLNLDGKIVSKKGGAVSCFNLPESFTWSNLACVGSSARFTNPVHGGGTGPALYGGYVLGKCVGKALKNKSSIEKALIDYQEEIKATRGKAHEYHYRVKTLLQACSDEELEIIFSSIRPEEWLRSMSFTKREMLRILGRISKRSLRLGLKVMRYLGLS
jgi:digeranylgeranylglycerophospholipid reductase